MQLIFVILCHLFSQHSIRATEFFCNKLAPCGCSKNDVITTRIIGGEPVVNHSWTWAVSLRTEDETHFCGGTILSAQFILTAAHCVEDPEILDYDLKAAVGTDTLSDKNGQRIPVSDIFLHPEWTSRTNENDIAILKLKTPIDFNDSSIARICFPSINTFGMDFPMVKSSLVAIGWGYTTPGGMTSDLLQQVTLEAIDNRELKCNQSINNVTVQFCAGVDGGGKDTCEGDSGGPLMYYSSYYRQWLMAGITSYGDGCGKSDRAGIYTRISRYIDWIRSITGQEGIVIVGDNASSIPLKSDILFSVVCLVFVQNFILYV